MKKHYIIFLYIIFLLIHNLYSQETVFVESNEFGRGILKSRPGECFVILPFHVIEENPLSNFSIIGNRNVISEGIFEQRFSSDLAIIRIIEGGIQECTEWNTPKDFTTILADIHDGYLELRNEFGTVDLLHVYLTGKKENLVKITPKIKNQAFTSGMSGGSLFTNINEKKIYLGMLLQINFKSGEGLVLKADNMERILYNFFHNPISLANKIKYIPTAIESSYFNYQSKANVALINLQDRNGINSVLYKLLSKEQHYTSTSYFKSKFLQEYKSKLWDEGIEILEKFKLPEKLNCIYLIKEDVRFNTKERMGHEFTSASGNVSIKVLNISSGESNTILGIYAGSGANEKWAYESFIENFLSEQIANIEIKNFELCKN